MQLLQYQIGLIEIDHSCKKKYPDRNSFDHSILMKNSTVQKAKLKVEFRCSNKFIKIAPIKIISFRTLFVGNFRIDGPNHPTVGLNGAHFRNYTTIVIEELCSIENDKPVHKPLPLGRVRYSQILHKWRSFFVTSTHGL